MYYSALPWTHAVSGDPRYARFLQTRKGNFKPIDSLEPGCRDLLNCVLEPNPKARYNCQNIIENEWFKSISGNCQRFTVVCSHLQHTSGVPHRHINAQGLQRMEKSAAAR
jgi:serine/threonine protein kinase